MTRDELIAALEAAHEPSRELDAEIAVATFSEAGTPGGLVYAKMTRRDDHCTPPGTFWRKDRSGLSLWSAAAYTDSLDAAMTLVPTVQTEDGPRMWDVVIGHTNGGLTIHAQVGPGKECFAETIPLALCIASLKALTPTINTREGE